MEIVIAVVGILGSIAGIWAISVKETVNQNSEFIKDLRESNRSLTAELHQLQIDHQKAQLDLIDYRNKYRECSEDLKEARTK